MWCFKLLYGLDKWTDYYLRTWGSLIVLQYLVNYLAFGIVKWCCHVNYIYILTRKNIKYFYSFLDTKKVKYNYLFCQETGKSVLIPTFPLLWSSNTIHMGNLNTKVVNNYQVWLITLFIFYHGLRIICLRFYYICCHVLFGVIWLSMEDDNKCVKMSLNNF